MTQACAHPQPVCSSPPPQHCNPQPQPHEANCQPQHTEQPCAPSGYGDCGHQGALLSAQITASIDTGPCHVWDALDAHLALDFAPDCCHV